MLPTLEDLGVRIHSDLKYESGSVDCDGELVVLGVAASLMDLQCSKCYQRMAMKAPADMSWQERADLA